MTKRADEVEEVTPEVVYAGTTPQEALLALADVPDTKDVETEVDGKKFKFSLKRLSSMKELNAETKKMKGRMDMLRVMGKVEVVAPAETVLPFLMKLDDAVTNGDKTSFFLKSKEAVAIATQIEGGVVGMDWPTAALFTCLQATVALWLNGQVNEMNNMGALAEAKNDWEQIPDES